MAVNNYVENTILTESKWNGTGWNIVIETESGFIFDGDITANYRDDDGYYESKTLTQNAEKTRADTYIFNEVSQYTGIDLYGNTVAGGGSSIEIINNITGDPTDPEYTLIDDVLTVSVKGSGNYKRFINPKATFTNTAGEPVTVDMQTAFDVPVSTATAVLTDVDINEPIVLTGKFTTVVLIEKYLTNCFFDTPVPDSMEEGLTLGATIRVNPDTEFTAPPVFHYKNDEGYDVNKEFVIASDGQTATGSILLESMTRIGINATTRPVEIVGKNYGSINVYKVTLDDLELFAEQRFFKVAGSDPETGATISEKIDLGAFVNRIKRIHTPIANGATDVIMCGEHNTNINVYQPATDTITLNFGSVSIPHYNADAVDYNSDIQLFLPFNGFVDIPTDYMGKDISLEYIINVITGGGIARIIFDGVPFKVEKIHPASSIIYRVDVDPVRTIGDDGFNEMLFYGLEPYVYCKWFKSDIDGGINGEVKQTIIGDLRGYNSLQYISSISSTQMLTSEQTLIYDALTAGVYIE